MSDRVLAILIEHPDKSYGYSRARIEMCKLHPPRPTRPPGQEQHFLDTRSFISRQAG